LTLCLEKSNFQIEPAFQEYYKKRFERTKRVVNMARYMGLFFHSENPLVHSIRQHLITWLMGSDMMLKLVEKEFYDNCPVPLENKKTVS
jgi:2-polyprenyl-6-methoxyphenol hydroxylase-like FAD-dependent oxidoreductase